MERVDVAYVRWERVTECGSRAAEILAPHGAEVVEGTVRWMEEEDLTERDGVVTWRRSEMRGVMLWMALNVFRNIFNCILDLTGCQ